MTFDRDELLARTDLPALADDILGPRKGRGLNASWSCPARHHGPQTGRTPPVTIFNDRNGVSRWHCHACGAGGTAIDLLIVAHGLRVRDAIEHLAARAGVVGEAGRDLGRPRPPRPFEPAHLPELRAATREIVDYVEACERHLWSPDGRRWRNYLAERRLSEAVLRANRVGADPGPATQRRARGLPHRGPAVVFPVLTGTREPAYLQARYLDPERAGRKYDNPVDSLAPSPRVVPVFTPATGNRTSTIIVCEGIPDALIAATAGYRAIAVLGAGLPDAAVARRVAQIAGRDRIVVAFDADPRGKDGGTRLHRELTRLASPRVARLELERGDLNDWARSAARRFPSQLHRRVTLLQPAAGRDALAPSL